MRPRAFLAPPSAGLLALRPQTGSAEDALKLRRLYNGDHSFSDLALLLDGTRVAVDGYMAPPLQQAEGFFVLTLTPTPDCPYCPTAADWSEEILAVYTGGPVDVLPFNVRIRVSGRLELGDHQDPATGFVSRVKLVEAACA